MKADVKHQSWTTAITFAEAGEWETARAYLPGSRQGRVAAWFQNLSMAVAFAEHGLHEEALRIAGRKDEGMAPVRPLNFFELCALGNVRCTYGVLSSVKLGVN